MSIKRVLTAVAAASLALGVGACSARPGVALVVDGVEYRTSEVQRVSAEVQAITGQVVPAQTVVNFISRTAAAKDMAREHGLALTTDKVRAEIEKEVRGLDSALSDLTIDTFYTNAVLNQLNEKLGAQQYKQSFLETQAKHKVEVNPRFGVVSESGSVLPPVRIGVVDTAATEVAVP